MRPNPPDKDKPKPPRNYFSRREQMRLLLLVGMLMVVFILMMEAAKPKNWQWMWGEAPPVEGGPPLSATELGGQDIDTRLAPAAKPAADLPGTVAAPNFRWRPDGSLNNHDQAQRRAAKDIWRQQLELLDRSQRRMVQPMLRNVRKNEPVEGDVAEQWSETIAALDENWGKYTQQAMEAVRDDQFLSDEDKAAWLLILHTLQKQWDGQLREALAGAAHPARLTEPQRQQLSDFQQLFDEMAVAAIEDNTFIDRPNERMAWFRLAEILQSAGNRQLADESIPRVGFRQLFEQPDQYRAELVRIRGHAKRAYRVRAPQNYLGIEHYYVFWILPAGGPTSPITVYSLDVPPNFPEIKDKDLDKTVTTLNEFVEFPGYFFKRMAYLTENKETRVTPLLLAKSPQWTPAEPPGDPVLPDLRLLGAAVLAAALFGVGAAAFIYLQNRKVPASKNYSPVARARPQHLAGLHDEPLAPEPGEALSQLAQQELQSRPADESGN